MWEMVAVAIIGLCSALVSYSSTQEANADTLDYAKDTNDTNYEHSKEAIQNKVADAKKAGVSPLAALNGSGSQLTTPMQYQAQAPQMDMSQLMSSITSLSNEYNSEDSKEYIAQLQSQTSSDNVDKQIRIEKLKIDNAMEMCKANIASSEKIAQGQLDEQARQADNKLNVEMKRILLDYDFNLENAQYEQSVKNQEMQLKSYFETADSLKQFCSNYDIPFRVVNYPIETEGDFDNLRELNKKTIDNVLSNYEIYSEWRSKPDRTSDDFSSAFSHSKTDSKSNTKGLHGGAGVTPSGSVLGGSANIGANFTDSELQSMTDSYTKSRMSQDFNFKKLFTDGGQRGITYYVPQYKNNFFKKTQADFSTRKYKSGSIRR